MSLFKKKKNASPRDRLLVAAKKAAHGVIAQTDMSQYAGVDKTEAEAGIFMSLFYDEAGIRSAPELAELAVEAYGIDEQRALSVARDFLRSRG